MNLENRIHSDANFVNGLVRVFPIAFISSMFLLSLFRFSASSFAMGRDDTDISILNYRRNKFITNCILGCKWDNSCGLGEWVERIVSY